ncbi:uncharacterized protein LOC119555671 [Drosophila subpulchrella]|uniref:uncharacterized protein LOC119555671 n=1 Tax=Drosophila subpulchrella TaxID=1486046 RepID=UPI0018A19F13|nr:uncharacterized protein LOC119555671 [Drosophila subpulchrella]
MELNGGCVVLSCLLIVLGVVAAQAIPLLAQYQMSLDVQSDLIANRYGESREQLSMVRQPKEDEDQDEDDDEEGFDDNITAGAVLEGFDEGSGEDCETLPYGPTTPGGQDQLTTSLVSCVPMCLFIIQFLS